jgi:proline iminopeptidase
MEKNNDFDNPKYSELLFKYYYTEHILRKPLKNGQNQSIVVSNTSTLMFMCIYAGTVNLVLLEMPSLKNWDVKDRLKH